VLSFPDDGMSPPDAYAVLEDGRFRPFSLQIEAFLHQLHTVITKAHR
jgi:hypothetical protein